MDKLRQVEDPNIGTTSPLAPQEPEQTQSSTSPLTEPETLFRRIQTYPWEQDAEFQAGLPYILQNTEQPDSARNTDLLLDVQCFYFRRKYKLPHPINRIAYKRWLDEEAQRTDAPEEAETDLSPQTTLNEDASAHPPPSTTTATDSTPPPYPTTFASIVDLISRNEPIPGIEEIPDTVLDASLSAPNQTPQRRKPWEKESNDESREGDGTAQLAS